MNEATNGSAYLDLFSSWLRTLGDDAVVLARVAGGELSGEERRYATAALNYIFKSLDLIPDGMDDLGYLDDCFVLRVAAARAVAEGDLRSEGDIARLAGDARAIADFLGEDFERLEAYVRALCKGAARGRTVDDILGDPAIARAFVQEVEAWARAYQTPSFARDTKTLIKLKAFLSAKLA